MIGKSQALQYYAKNNFCAYYLTITEKTNSVNYISQTLSGISNFTDWRIKIHDYSANGKLKRATEDNCSRVTRIID